MGSRPVRIGNAAYTHLQLDIYGELMDSVYLYDKYGSPIGHDPWMNVVRLIDWVCEHWREKDESIWEVRGGRQEFLYSRVMCWVAIDRAIRLANKRSFPAPLVTLARGPRHDLPRHLRALLGPGARRLRPASGRGDVRRGDAAHAAGTLRLADRPALDFHARAASSESW